MATSPLYYLPLELWIKIASTSSKSWWLFTLAIPQLGRYSLQPHVQKRMKSKFVKKTETFWDYIRVAFWELPNGGKLHSPNSDQPAYIQYYANGSKEYEHWYKDGKLHRENDQPALIVYYSSEEGGSRKYENWYKDGKFIK